MANEREKTEEKEMKIPVFSVIKKGSVLKNIILNTLLPEPEPSTESCEGWSAFSREEEPILFGRHPDCHILLDHPSVSRLHLEVRVELPLQKLSVTDRSSVHGTWVSGTKIPPNVPIEVGEGDIVRLGASTREYRLQWVSLGRVFEMDNPLSPLLEEKEEQHQEDKPGQMIADLNELWGTEIPSAPPMPEYINPSPSDVPFYLPVEAEERNRDSKGSSEKNSSFFSATSMQESAGSSIPGKEEIRSPEIEHRSVAGSEKQGSSLLSRRSKSKSVSFLRIHTGRSKISNMISDAKVEPGVQKESGELSEKSKQEETICRTLFDNLGGKEEEKEEEETFESDKENMTPEGSIGRKLKSRRPDLLRSSLIVAAYLNVEEDACHLDKENWTPEVLGELKLNEPTSHNLLKSEGDEEIFGTDKENARLGISSDQKIKKKSCTRLQRSSSNTITASNVVEGVFHSDKENWTPEIPQEMKSSKPSSGDHMKTEEKEEEGESFPSDKENWSPQVSGSLNAKKGPSQNSDRIKREVMGKRVDRIPFQLLLENPSSRKSNSGYHVQMNANDGNCTSVNHTRGIGDVLNSFSIPFMDKGREEKRIWNMVVDTSCFLDDEARRSLQLLEGIKGTHLIIPRIVIRELDSLSRRESLFRKSTKASSVLQWIEECMVKTSWWIHVQSSMETMPVAPTPPASPPSQLGNGSSDVGSMAFSAWGTLMEIVSPTAEDHILDSALLYKKMRSGQLVLLSNSVTLKIKAMAEGLICESPKEFRESLVNPFSKRFLWVDSSPRGSTWSCSDEMGLEEYYHHQRPSARKAGKAAEAVKGLKLILLHNSHYR